MVCIFRLGGLHLPLGCFAYSAWVVCIFLLPLNIPFPPLHPTTLLAIDHPAPDHPAPKIPVENRLADNNAIRSWVRAILRPKSFWLEHITNKPLLIGGIKVKRFPSWFCGRWTLPNQVSRVGTLRAHDLAPKVCFSKVLEMFANFVSRPFRVFENRKTVC